MEFDTLQSNLDLNNHKIINAGTPSDDKDCAPKSYVDGYVNASNRTFNESLTRVKYELKESLARIKFKLYSKFVIKHTIGNDHEFNHDLYRVFWYLGVDRRTWYDSRFDHCKKLKVDFKTDGINLTILCKSTSLPPELTGNLLLKRDINVKITNIPIFPSNIGVAGN